MKAAQSHGPENLPCETAGGQEIHHQHNKFKPANSSAIPGFGLNSFSEEIIPTKSVSSRDICQKMKAFKSREQATVLFHDHWSIDHFPSNIHRTFYSEKIIPKIFITKVNQKWK